MLEVFAIISLCRLNRRNALARGKRPGGFIALTIILWIVFEFIGAILGILIFGRDNSYASVLFVALPCAALGGLISFLCAKFGPRGDYVEPGTMPAFGNNGAPVYTNPNAAQVPMNQPAYMYNPNMYQQAPQQPVAAQPSQPASPFVPAQTAGAATMGTRYCRHCGSPNNGTNRFCEYCGQNIE